MNQEESEHNEVDGMKKGVDSKGEVMHMTVEKQRARRCMPGPMMGKIKSRFDGVFPFRRNTIRRNWGLGLGSELAFRRIGTEPIRLNLDFNRGGWFTGSGEALALTGA